MTLSFVTPYWSGAEMMRVHLASIRNVLPGLAHPRIEAGRRADGDGGYQLEFGVQYLARGIRLRGRTSSTPGTVRNRVRVRRRTRYGVAIEPRQSAGGARDGRWDLVGMEERVRDSPTAAAALPSTNGWWRFAPGQVAGPLLMFNWREFRRRWGMSGVRGRRSYGAWEYEYDHGIGQKLTRHKYLLPFHTTRYGMGNLLKDGDAAVLWHQWYGSYRTRFDGQRRGRRSATGRSCRARGARQEGEAAFLADYPDLDLSNLPRRGGPIGISGGTGSG